MLDGKSTPWVLILQHIRDDIMTLMCDKLPLVSHRSLGRHGPMSVRIAAPATIATLPRRNALAFLTLFFIPSVAQAILLTVVPLEALGLLGNARAVTLLYVCTGLIVVGGRFSIPLLLQLIRRRFVFTLGTVSLAASGVLLAVNALPALAAGLILSAFGFACIEITSQLYLLDHVARRALRHFEPIRIFAIAGLWTLGPWFGVWAQHNVGFSAPFAITATVAIVLLALFWSMRLGENVVLSAARRRMTPNPLRYLPRFFAQPRLRLAWALASARSSWWNVFYIYTPIFAVISGLGAETGGVVVSIGTGWIWLAPLWGWLGRRYRLRRLLCAGYVIAGVLSLCVAVAFDVPWLAALLLVAAALGTEVIDGAGNLLFLRAVHPHERTEMTTVFVSFRDVAQLGPPAVCSVLLSLFSLPSVFVAAAAMMLGSAWVCRHIPKKL
jgi:MFS transporter, ACDE family, multidrug resistance protein